jgi:dipeptidyl aminopeptidase/acylaminoacyl peptidase
MEGWERARLLRRIELGAGIIALRTPNKATSRGTEMRKIIYSLTLTTLCYSSASIAQERLTPELLWQLKRVAGPAVSPDGARFVYGVRQYAVRENRGNTDLYLLAVDGGEPIQLTDTQGSEFNAVWRPDGRRIGFLSAQSGSVQLWEMDADGMNAHQVTNIAGGIGNFSYAPDGRHVAFTRDVKLDETPNDEYPDLPLANARIIDELMYRHWDQWHDYTYRHLFVAEYENGQVGAAIDIMQGERFDTPLKPFGGVEQVGWSPDGGKIAYTSKKMRGTAYAVSTNSDVFVYDLETGQSANLTVGMMGYDTEPRFSPDGRFIAWLSMERDGYEADRNRLFSKDLGSGETRELTVDFDQDVHGPAWSPDGSTIYFTSDIRGTVQLYAAELGSGQIRKITDGVHNYGAFELAEYGGSTTLIASRSSMSAPADIYRVEPTSGAATQLTFANRPMLDGIAMGRVEERIVQTTDNKEMPAWLIYPPDFDPARRYPALLYCKGGPQGAMSQSFSYRWNFQLMAANGYIVIAPSRRGSSSLGQEWEEQISGDWGGQAMQDLLSAIDDLAREPYVDKERLGAVGASFGGYSVFWLAGNHAGRFKAFIAHDGVFNLESMYGSTEEMFFVNFDLGGPYWENADSYRRFSPHLSVGSWDTPMLVIHGGQDFRIPAAEAMQAFTALQIRGIPSRFLYFPEENHWVLSAQNGILWQRVFYDWLDSYLK